MRQQNNHWKPIKTLGMSRLRTSPQDFFQRHFCEFLTEFGPSSKLDRVRLAASDAGPAAMRAASALFDWATSKAKSPVTASGFSRRDSVGLRKTMWHASVGCGVRAWTAVFNSPAQPVFLRFLHLFLVLTSDKYGSGSHSDDSLARPPPPGSAHQEKKERHMGVHVHPLRPCWG